VARPPRRIGQFVDRSYTWGLTVAFEDLASTHAYQVDETHLDFRDTCSKVLPEGRVYDFGA
jgi:hypothetical protein